MGFNHGSMCESARRRDRAASLAHGSPRPRRRRRVSARSSARRIKLVDQRRARLAAGRLHHLADEKAEHLGLARAVLSRRLGMRGEHLVDRGGQRAFVADLRQARRPRRWRSPSAPRVHIFSKTSLAVDELITRRSTRSISPASATGADGALGQRQPGVVERARHLAHQPVGRRLGAAHPRDDGREPLAESRATASTRSRRTATSRTPPSTARAVRPAARAARRRACSIRAASTSTGGRSGSGKYR